MTFLNPALLFGLLAAAIPILLHLLNLRKLRTIEFSTLTFLKELQRTRIRRIKIRQWVLLALRTLLVALVVMAFSRPTLEGPLAGALGERARTTAVFIIDDSYSMTAVDEYGELLQQARTAAQNAVDLLNEGDEAFLVKLSEISPATTQETPPPTRNLLQLRSAIVDIAPSYRHRKLDDALRYASRLMATSKNFNKEVYVLSDFQRGAFHVRPTAEEQLFDESVRFFFVPFGRRPPHNLGVERVAIPQTIVEVGKPLTVQATIRNESADDVRGHMVSLFLNGDRVSQRPVDLAAGEATEVEFAAIPRRAGWLSGYLELETDDLEFDNRRYFVMKIPETLRILLAGARADAQFIRLALETRIVGNGTALQLGEVPLDRLSGNELTNADVVVLANPGELTRVQLDRLRAFLDAGGGLVVFPGSHTTPVGFNTTLSDILNLPPLARIDIAGRGTAEENVQSHFEIERVDDRHPLFQGIFDEARDNLRRGRPTTRPRALESPRILTSARLQATPTSHAIITLSNGAPFLLDQPAGSGRVLLYAVSATLDWSDFPLKGLFVPLLHRSVSYLAQRSQQQQDYGVGDELVIRERSRSAGRLTMTDPEFLETVVQPEVVGVERVVRFPATGVPGLYALKDDTDTTFLAAVNLDPAESHTARIDDDAFGLILQQLQIRTSLRHGASASDLQQRVMQARFGTELWRYFLIAALMIAVLEMLLARDGKKDLASLTPATG
jgi:hypothetical protein